MVQQQKKAGGKKLRRCTHKSPSEMRTQAKGIGKPRKYRARKRFIEPPIERYHGLRGT